MPNYSHAHIRRMEPRKLLLKLMQRDGDNPSSLARKLRDAVKQPQIHKFLAGTAREPRRSTLKPLADYYNIPLDAFYDPDVADQVAQQLGATGSPVPAMERPPTPPPIPIDQASKWPFKAVTFRRYQGLTAEARQDIERHLEILVEKWESVGQTKKRRAS